MRIFLITVRYLVALNLSGNAAEPPNTTDSPYPPSFSLSFSFLHNITSMTILRYAQQQQQPAKKQRVEPPPQMMEPPKHFNRWGLEEVFYKIIIFSLY